jgi:hypothetical protein
MFAQTTERASLAPVDSLTSGVRYLLAEGEVQGTLPTLTEAARYRQDILNLTDENLLQRYTGFTAADYDRYVLLPFLYQEMVRQQRSVASPEALYHDLAQEQRVIILSRALIWDTDKAAVISR